MDFRPHGAGARATPAILVALEGRTTAKYADRQGRSFATTGQGGSSGRGFTTGHQQLGILRNDLTAAAAPST